MVLLHIFIKYQLGNKKRTSTGRRTQLLSYKHKHIGPVSFLIYVDELAKLLERHGVVVKLFADDVKVYLEICNVDDAAKLQKALDLIAEWADDWQLGLSIGKCKCNTLSIGKHQDTTQYYIDGTELPCLPPLQGLGCCYYLRPISITPYTADYYQGPPACRAFTYS